jgi:hypothetical protein
MVHFAYFEVPGANVQRRSIRALMGKAVGKKQVFFDGERRRKPPTFQCSELNSICEIGFLPHHLSCALRPESELREVRKKINKYDYLQRIVVFCSVTP